MDLTITMLAQGAQETAEGITTISGWIDTQPIWGIKLLLCLVVATAVLVGLVFRRQQKIAQNQVDLAKLLERLIERE